MGAGSVAAGDPFPPVRSGRSGPGERRVEVERPLGGGPAHHRARGATPAPGRCWLVAMTTRAGVSIEAMGGVVGALNGLGITRGGVQPFIMTLAMLVIARGVTLTYSDAKPIRAGDAAADIAWIGNGSLAGIPVPFLMFLGIAALAWFTLNHTTFGRAVYAVGDNLEAARLSGIPTRRIIFSVYVISGLCAAISALIVVSRLAAAEATQGEGFELDAIAIVVIGGTSLFGGSGGVGGTLVGAGIVAAVNNLLNLLGVPPFSQRIAKGLIILGAVLLERRARGKEEGR